MTTGYYSLESVGDVGAVPDRAQSGLGVRPDIEPTDTITGMGLEVRETRVAQEHPVVQ